MQRKSHRLVAVLTLLALVLTAVPVAAAPTASDIKGHWAETAIQQLMDLGAVSGLPDGTFRPDLTVTRAEFVTMVNKSLGITPVTGSSHFLDVKPQDWFAGQVEAAAAYGYVTGNPDGTFGPYRPITREQAAAMLVRVFGFSKLATAAKQDTVLVPFADAGKVSAWAKADVATAVSLGLLSGYTPDTLAPQPAGLSAAGWQQWEAARSTEQREAVLKKQGSTGLITRAQTAAIIVRALDKKPVSVEATVFDKAGTYGLKEGVETITGDVVIKAEAVTLRNLIITGDLAIAETVGDGTVILDNVTVKGDTQVKGGGINSVIFRSCTLQGTVTVEKVDGQIRIVAEGSTSVPKIILQSGAILISRDDGSFERVELPKDLAKNTEITLTGNFGEVEIAAEKANVTVGAGTTIDDLVLSKNATGTKVDLDKKASVKTVTANAKVEITGQGSIGTAEINTDGVTIEQKPDEIDWGKGVESAIIAGKTQTPPRKPSGGGGGGPGGDKTVPVSTITVNPETMTLTVGGATGTIIATVNPSNATNKTVTWTSSDENVATVDNGVVTAKSVGTATITATSAADSSKKASCVVTVVAELTITKLDVVDGKDGVTPIVTPTVGQVIRANIILSDGTPIYTYPVDSRVTYKWYYAESTDTILGTEGSYTVTSDNIGKKICVEVKVEGIGEDTWTADGPVVDKSALTTAIADANTNKGTAVVSADGSDADPAEKWVTQEVMTAYETAISAAQAVADKEDATQAEVDQAVADLGTATDTFNTAKKAGTKVATLESIAITIPATKTAYKVGEELDISGMVVTGTYSDESTKEEKITAANVSGFDSSAVVAEQTLTVTVGGKTATYTISVAKADGPALEGVTADDDANTLTGMASGMEFSTNGTDWTKYVVDPSNLPDLTGTVALQVRVAATDTHTAGPATTFNFTVPAPATLESIAITTPATKTEYQVGEELDITGMVVTGTYSDESTKVEEITAANVSGFDSSAVVAEQILTVTVGGKTTTYIISVAKADGPGAITEEYAGTFPVEATSINLTGLAPSATGLEAAVAIDGTDYGNYADLTVDGSGNAAITGLTGVTTSTKVKVRVKETATHLAGTDKEISVTAEAVIEPDAMDFNTPAESFLTGYTRPSALYDGTNYYLWYRTYGTTPMTTYHRKATTIEDLKTATPNDLKLGGTTWEGLDNFSIIKVAEKYYMFNSKSGGTEINVYESGDGVTWGNTPTKVLDTSTVGDWAKTKIDNPIVIYDGTEYKLYYQGKSGSSGYQIGLATSNSLTGSYTAVAEPVLTPGTSGEWDVGTLYQPWVVKDGDFYYMWYAAGNGPKAIGYAWSTDGINWTKTDNAVIASAELWQGKPSVVKVDSDWHMWFLHEKDSSNSDIMYINNIEGAIPQVATPVIAVSKESAANREAGVTFSVAADGVTFYYTLDGSNPTSGSNLYTDTVTLTAPDQDAEANITIKVIGTKAGTTDSEVASKTVTYAAKPANNAPTVKTGQGTQTGNATPAATSGNPAAVEYTADVSTWFEDADVSDTLTYSVVSAVDNAAPANDVSSDVQISGVNVTYTPKAAQASKTVTIGVKANDGTADSTGNVTITVTVGAVPADADTTAPVLSATSASAITDTTATLNFTSDEAGTYYYLVYAAADAVPDKATVKAQGDAVAKGTGGVSAAANTANVTGLTAETAYKAYVVVADAGNNISDVATIEITTTAAPVTSATIDPTTANFDKKTEAQADVITTITWGSAASVTAVKNGETALTVDTNYTVAENTLTINKEYLAAQAVGDVALSIEFDKGDAATLTIIISDTTPVPKYTATFTVTDGTNPITGAEITIDSRTLITDAGGKATIELADGTYTYGVTATGFDAITDGSITVSGAAVDKAVTMTAAGTPAAPQILLAVVKDKDGTSEGTYNVGDTLTITFDVPTNKTGSLDKTSVDAIIDWGKKDENTDYSFGTNYSGEWTDDRTLVITAIDTEGINFPPDFFYETIAIGIKSTADIRTADGKSEASSSTRTITGAFFQGPTVISSVTSLLSNKGALREAPENDGSLRADIDYLLVTLGYNTGKFEIDIASGVTANNLPSGLGFTVQRTSGNQLTITLTGKAENHAGNDSINDLSFTFSASKINGAISDITTPGIDLKFIDQVAIDPIISNVSNTSFDMYFRTVHSTFYIKTATYGKVAVDNLQATHLELKDEEAKTVTIDSINTTDGGKTYTVYATLPWGKTYTLNIEENHKFKFLGNKSVVAKYTPVVDTPVSATPVIIGQTLSDSSLTGTFKHPETGAAVEGSLTWDNLETTVDTTKNYLWRFAPTDTTNYTATSGTVQVTANTAVDSVTATLASPKIGESGGTATVDGAANYTHTSTAWSGKAGDTFAAGETPVAVITLAAKQGYVFTGLTADNITVEGGEVSYEQEQGVLQDGKTLVFTVTYSQLSEQ